MPLQSHLDNVALEELEKKYDTALNTRDNGPALTRLIYWATIAFALYHLWTAGFGTPVDHVHMGIHLAGLFLFIFVGFPLVKTSQSLAFQGGRWWAPGNVPLYDWILAGLAIAASLFLWVSWRGFSGFGFELDEQALRQGNPSSLDVFFGSVLILTTLEIARRTIGFVLPLIILVFMSYALFGPYMPAQILKHPGVDWHQFVNNMYFPSEGIFGVTLWVVSTVVFHFVLFGVVAQRMGLGQFFVDNAMILAGRYTGGPAKVSVVSSAFFGTISGSSIANTVSTGSLTIPNMKKMGYPGHFAGGVEAASSAGGQITPPIMGAASFLMAEYLEVPYTTIVIAAIVPALMHYIGVLSIVHFTAKKLGLHAYPKEELPKVVQVWKDGWFTIIPLIALLIILFSGYSPNMAAFVGLILCIIVGFCAFDKPATLVVPLAFLGFVFWKASPYSGEGYSPTIAGILAGLTLVGTLHRNERQSFRDLFDSFHVGVQYALAVGAASAAVGIVVGVINTTGVGFRLGFMVTGGAADIAITLAPLLDWTSLAMFDQSSIQQFVSLMLIAMACILMGAGLPTTALYIMLVAVATPALSQLGVPPLATHMFVLYYGVISEITPPVCASAYAAAGIAGSNPFRTGLNAFTLGLGKLMVPMVFVYAPTMLIVLEEHFTLISFLQVTTTCALGVFAIATAVSAFFLAPLRGLWRLLMAIGGLLLVAPSLESDLVALLVMAPVGLQQLAGLKREATA
ncbi:TRAP transporter fused permease subunit [Marivita sp. XM-24bin2]|jgi:TRAP transporter 4TM/12TM fusion protein|uniref:TRAP transporter permease n=1 Tax=unclassified Marivita TaxID=2632480 RepID=UPI000D7A2E97|nr:TRAP transporter fused permease subunit [Marivita sp. XM-24bin2]MCR9109105.1 TRAP transporter fused permease subunit [Paracoccaceae bacterium]PWL36893.1 MAG: C4-dicarboxylate ABC transporter permease [Marivita sp. XM-24bin2]